MLVKRRETGFLSAGVFRAFSKLDHISSQEEGWGAAWDFGSSGKDKIHTSPHSSVGRSLAPQGSPGRLLF